MKYKILTFEIPTTLIIDNPLATKRKRRKKHK